MKKENKYVILYYVTFFLIEGCVKGETEPIEQQQSYNNNQQQMKILPLLFLKKRKYLVLMMYMKIGYF